MKTLLKNANVISMDEKMPIIFESDILINDDIIIKIENNISEEADNILDLNGNYVLPGFINAHNHLPMTLFRGYKQDKKLMDWLNNYIFPAEKNLTPEITYLFSKLACAEMLKSGITTTLDMYFFEEEIFKAIDESGIRANIGISISDNTDFNYVEKYLEDHNGKNSRINNLISPHSGYLCNEQTLKKCISLAKKYATGIQIHVAETQDEINSIREKYNKTPIEFLNDLNLFEVNTIIAHGIYLNDNDINILKNISGGIVHNPVSNAILASGICNVRKLMDSGITVCLGTDGAGSTAALNMFDEMKLCGYLQKLNNMNPEIITAYEILKMATINGAKALNMSDKIGSIEVNKKADLVVFNMDSINVSPKNDIISSLIYSVDSSNIELVMVDGKTIVEKNNILNLDEKQLIKKCNMIANEFFK